MCGIVGALSERNVIPILVEGLKRLEYRGYDSAGIAVLRSADQEIERVRTQGKVASLQEMLTQHPVTGSLGIAHTRWATHGVPSIQNAHPHMSSDEVVIVHNGIIENHELLRNSLSNQGYVFETETDTEVIVHQIHAELSKGLAPIEAIRAAMQALEGAYAVGIILKSMPDRLYAVRKGSPLVLGLGIGEVFLASDALALVSLVNQFVYLEEGDLAELHRGGDWRVYDEKGQAVYRPIKTSELKYQAVGKGAYRHFMQKEIYEQPDVLSSVIGNHLRAGLRVLPESFGLNARQVLPEVRRIHIIACGTSYHAALVARYWLEQRIGLPTQVEIASEYRYRNPVVEENTLFVALSQSGETADTLAAMRMAKSLGYLATLGICNNPESTLVRESDLVFLMGSGPEIGVAATKTFTAQLMALLLLTEVLSQFSPVSRTQESIGALLGQLPELIQETLRIESQIERLVPRFLDKTSALFLGRGIHFPIALEGALKLKEISYLHAEAYPAGELKHGPLALVDREMPVIVLVPNNHLLDKVLSNIHEVEARQGELFLFADQSLKLEGSASRTIISLPDAPEVFSPIIHTIPLQILAYHVAAHKGTDVDQPRNLAKSVTVE